MASKDLMVYPTSIKTTTLEEVRDRTRKALGITEKIPNVWDKFCAAHLSIQKRDHPEADEQTLLKLTEIAILTYYLEESGQSEVPTR